ARGASRTACEDSAGAFADAWTADRKHEIEGALLASKLSYAEDTGRHVIARMDAFASDWKAMWLDVCEAHARPEESLALHDRRMECLEDPRLEFEALGGVLAEPDPELLRRVVDPMENLGRIADCGSSERLVAASRSAQETPPADARRDVARAEALVLVA